MKNNNKVLSSAKFVVENADFVSINELNLEKLIDSFKIQPDSNWLDGSPFPIDLLNEEEKLMFSVVFNAISFSYWGEPYWNVEYLGTLHTRGSWSLVASIFRSIEENNSLLDPKILKELDISTLRKILRGNTEIPLIQERLMILNKVGDVIEKKFNGKFTLFLDKYGNNSNDLIEGIISEFEPSFNDYYSYKGEVVYFNKRAQALIESIYSLFKGISYGDISNIQELTALADYIIPNLLRHIGVIVYKKELSDLIDNKVHLQKGSNYEIEIRGATIWVVELMRQKLEIKGTPCKSQNINDYLWTIGRDVNTPFHLIRTTAY